MRNRRLFTVTTLAALLGATPLSAAPPADDTAVAPPRSSDERPEYRPEPIADDVFKPSKEISDDYPADFPVDI